jgi:diadenosine tetraphosphatase ApaH/serine/threonine PP2A family protein phosphatase
MEVKRTIIVGDIHGCIEEFNELIDKLSYNKEFDRLILLGDLIDRGPDSVAVVKRARKLDLECVMGNHEHKFLKWYKSSGSKNDVYDRRPHYTQFSDEDINYIARMDPYISLPDMNTVIVHAGLRPGINLQNQTKDDLYYIRYMDSDSKFISLKKISRLGKDAIGAHFWTEFWSGPESVVYGHNVHSFENPLIEKVSSDITCYGLDTGCCFGGRLTALILETKEIVQVQAKRTYYKSDYNIR